MYIIVFEVDMFSLVTPFDTLCLYYMLCLYPYLGVFLVHFSRGVDWPVEVLICDDGVSFNIIVHKNRLESVPQSLKE